MILDLSHSAAPRSAAAIDESGVLCLVNRRGGINNGAEEQLRSEELEKMRSAERKFAEGNRGAAQAKDWTEVEERFI